MHYFLSSRKDPFPAHRSIHSHILPWPLWTGISFFHYTTLNLFAVIHKLFFYSIKLLFFVLYSFRLKFVIWIAVYLSFAYTLLYQALWINLFLVFIFFRTMFFYLLKFMTSYMPWLAPCESKTLCYLSYRWLAGCVLVIVLLFGTSQWQWVLDLIYLFLLTDPNKWASLLHALTCTMWEQNFLRGLMLA